MDDEFPVMSYELLDWFIVAQIAEIAKDRHKPLGFERERINVNIVLGVGREDDPFLVNLIREK